MEFFDDIIQGDNGTLDCFFLYFYQNLPMPDGAGVAACSFILNLIKANPSSFFPL